MGKVRDKIMHGKTTTEDEIRNAIACVLKYAEEVNEQLYATHQLKPFGDLRGFGGRATRLNKSTSSFVLKGLSGDHRLNSCGWHQFVLRWVGRLVFLTFFPVPSRAERDGRRVDWLSGVGESTGQNRAGTRPDGNQSAYGMLTAMVETLGDPLSWPL